MTSYLEKTGLWKTKSGLELNYLLGKYGKKTVAPL